MALFTKGGGGARGKVLLDSEPVKQLEMTSYKGSNPLAIDEEGLEITANTLIEEALQIISNVKKEGKYVWKKYATKPVELHMAFTDATHATITSDTSVNFTSDFFVGYKGTYLDSWGMYGTYELEFLTGTTFKVVETPVGGTPYEHNLTYSFTPTTGTSLTITTSGFAGISGVTNMDLIPPCDYVTSDDITSYPADGEQDGYYYQLLSQPIDLADTLIKQTNLLPENIREGIDIFGVLGTMSEGISAESFGCSKIAIDKYTPTANGAFTNIPHSLGEVPSLVIVIAHALHPANGGLWRTFHCSDINGGSFYASSSDKPTMTIYYRANYSKYSVSNDNLTKTASTITNPGTYVGAGIEYTIITGV